jgi:hypothetical protein
MGGWMNPKAGLDARMRRKKILSSAGNRMPIVQVIGRTVLRITFGPKTGCHSGMEKTT